MMIINIDDKLKELGVNVTAKKHSATGLWDMRAYHPYDKQECLCSVQKDTVDAAWLEMTIKLPMILEKNEKRLLAINKKRESSLNKKEKPTNFWSEWQ